MTTSSTERTIRTYGGWRQTRGIGLFGVGPVGTAVVLTVVVATLLAASISFRLFVIALPCSAVVVGATVTRVGGQTLVELATRRLAWWWAVRRGATAHRVTTIDENPRAWDLPGVLAPTRLVSVDDGRGAFALVWNRRTGHLTATLACAASSTWLVDTDDADGWVANWHSWLAGLGYLPMVRSVAVTVETAPEAGTRLHDVVLPRLAPGAPADTLTLMRDLVARSPAASADVSTRVSVTFDPATSAVKLTDLDAAAAEVSRQLTGLESSLASCGVTVLRRCTAADVAGVVRVAFDPASRGDVDRTRVPGSGIEPLAWAEAGPVGADEAWDHYRHDGAWSITWGWQEAPRQRVTSGVLTRLLAPGRFAKRVTILYRPLPAGEAARVLEAQVNAAAFRDAYRRTQRRDETARDAADRARAHAAAAEEAQGAGVVLMSLYVTATVTDATQLAEAAADVESRADQAKIRLRRVVGAQAAGFARTLGVTGS